MSGRIKISPSSFNESLILVPCKLLFTFGAAVRSMRADFFPFFYGLSSNNEFLTAYKSVNFTATKL